MNKTKLLSLLLVLVMALSLVACAKGEKKDTPSDTQAVANDEGDAAEVTETPEEVDIVPVQKYEGKDLQKRVIRIGSFYDYFWDSKFKTLDDIEAAGLTYSNATATEMVLAKLREIEEKWNCTIEWVNLGWDGIQSSINTSITAGAPDCDIYVCDLQFALPPVLNGYAYKLSEICPPNADVLTEKVVVEAFNALGETDYLFHEVVGYPTGGMFMGYNADMLDSLGLERPEELVKRGEWTWDKFAEYAKICTQDTDGDGNPDIYGYGSAWNFTVEGFKASNNGVIAATLNETLSSPEVVETFEFIRRLHVEDKTARPEQSVWEDNTYGWSTGKVVFGFVHPWQLDGQAGKYDFELRICPTPVGPSGDGTMTSPLVANNYFIAKGIEDPTSVYCVFEELINWYNNDTEWRDDPSYLEALFADEEQLALALELSALAMDDNWQNIDRQTWSVSTVFHSVIDGSSTVAQAIEANRQLLQEELDAFK